MILHAVRRGARCALAATVAGLVAAAAPAAAQHRIFVSGHSLTDDPFGSWVARIATSIGAQSDWNQQIVIGSPISWRTRGDENRPEPWNGYTMGKNAQGRENSDVLAEFGRAAESRPYDVLILAEGHNTVAAVMWNDTTRHARHYHDRFIEQNPEGQSIFFEPWESVRDRADAAPWIALERQASEVWSCVVARVNDGLERAGRPDRMLTLPAGLALASLVEAMIAGDVEGLEAANASEAFDLLLIDDVHLKPLGTYFMALLAAGAATGLPLDGAWAPPQISEPQAAALKGFAATFLEGRLAPPERDDFAGCRAIFTSGFCDAWNAYVPDGQWMTPQPGCAPFFERARFDEGDERFHMPNPFALPADAAAEAEFWLPAP
jgi:hypothetical protein